MTSTPKHGPKLEKQAIWRDPSSNGFYVWGGTVVYSDTPPAKELWHFEVDGNGGGTWTQVTPASVVAFSKLTRTTEAYLTQSKDVGYYFGGFLYGGMSTATGSVSGDVYVLSLPGFVFFKAAGSSAIRADHAPDPWRLGLGISDMTEMRWSDGYDYQATTYESSDAVKRCERDFNSECVSISQDIDQAAAAPTNSTSDPSPTEQSNAGSATSTPQGSKPSNPPIGTIVGAVVGGVVGLVLVICLVVFFLRRKRYQAAPQQETGGTPPEYEKPGSAQYGYNGPAGINALHEGYTDHFNPVELPAEHGAAELSSTHGRYELGQTVARPS
ncbi:kelch repeat protein [Colletotrichum lupini]|uniref:Kelch repeat protein n=1 Tax=Colletotrichum lupini TaxID=145971 RepID=A0A9Q8SSI0_9PEZI|nr:kelch repeat protein [Colletotrichum lupini]UQC82696.1 kelch repeat protein [Colletotrichum lupini]